MCLMPGRIDGSPVMGWSTTSSHSENQKSCLKYTVAQPRHSKIRPVSLALVPSPSSGCSTVWRHRTKARVPVPQFGQFPLITSGDIGGMAIKWG